MIQFMGCEVLGPHDRHATRGSDDVTGLETRRIGRIPVPDLSHEKPLARFEVPRLVHGQRRQAKPKSIEE